MKGKPGNPKPKPGFSGGPGSGRKSIRGRKTAKEEHQRYMDELALMYDPQDIEALKDKVGNKTPMSPREIMLLRELGGSERLLATHFNKVVPDKIEHSGPEGKPIPILQILAKKKPA